MKKGVLLVNLGSPKSPTPEDVKPYLEEFLMDKYVIDTPYLLRAFLVKGIILGLKKRAVHSAEAYQQIWWNEGSPLIVLSRQLQSDLQLKLDIPITLGMRYGEPSIASALEELHRQNIDDILVIPLYPQYAMATTLTIIELANQIQQDKYPQMRLTHLPAFYNKPEYIKALSDNIRRNTQNFDYDKIIFSYHGVPERHIRKTTQKGTHQRFTPDVYCCQPNSKNAEFCYRNHCYQTTELVIQSLNIPKEKTMTTFQSRLSGDKWLDPYTDEEINKLPQKGIKKIAVVTPAFVSDCLETLEEIGMRAKEDFIKNGGEEFLAIPCLNTDPLWVDALHTWINNWIKQ
ncbi:MAG: ferrochelatase [Bacteroidota bacterium]|nr:ferrochelatase [Bacteroidota bacterium]